ncbi:MAG: YggT family protein [Sphingomonadales bacterium]|jgi:YggT family protein|nr:YggT family protein [Sphingomonadales bacterium]
MLILIDVLSYLLYAAWIVIVVQIILSWLVVFRIVNTYNPLVRGLLRGLERMTEPLYRPIRRILPDFGGLDFSPIVVFLVIGLLQRVLADVRWQILLGSMR